MSILTVSKIEDGKITLSNGDELGGVMSIDANSKQLHAKLTVKIDAAKPVKAKAEPKTDAKS